MQNYLQLLRENRDYARLWVAQAISLLGDWFNTVVLFALVAAYSPAETQGIALSGLLLARFLPPLIVGPYAGVLVDRFNRKRLLIVSDLLRAVTVLLFLLVRGPEQLWLVYTLTVIQWTFSAVFEPGRSALIPSLVGRDDLVRANTLGSVTWSVMLAAGAAIGGLVAGSFGTAFALIVDSLSFLLSALFISQIRLNSNSLPDSLIGAAARQDDRSRTSFREGIRYLAAHLDTAAVLLIKLGGSVGNIDLLLTIYATVYFPLGDNGTWSLGILWSAFGVGAIIGPIVLNRFNDGTVRIMRRLILIGYVWIALGWLLFGLAPSLPIAAAAIAVKAMGSSIYWTYSSVIIQKSVDDDYLGRVFAIDQAGFQLSTVISVIIVGAVVDAIGRENARAVSYGTALVSLIPLAAWAVLVPMLERRETARTPSVEGAGD